MTGIMEIETLKTKLRNLKAEHRSIDEQIQLLTHQHLHDQLAVQRMKKRKLQLKDEILNVEAKIIPDIIA